jgi:hypothetical protein
MEENAPLQLYGDLLFVRRCPECGRYVKADPTLHYEVNGLEQVRFTQPNATCSKHGRVLMEWAGYYP